MAKSADFLVEIGTEELPPKALRALMDAFAADLSKAFESAPARPVHSSVFMASLFGLTLLAVGILLSYGELVQTKNNGSAGPVPDRESTKLRTLCRKHS